jgi:TolA-binding protein
MTAPSCPRLFEVEASRDGRLAGAELASFERHMRACPACWREAQALEALAVALHAGSAGKRDELHVRRERTRLLASFDGELVVPKGHSGHWLLWPVSVAALVVGLLLVFWRVRSVEPARASSAVVRASSTAVWSEKRQAHLDQVRLERGSLWLHVDHSSRQDQRLLVALPDGELEDTGTTFSVSAEDGRTTRVEVQDGSVLLRLRGSTPVAIGAGGTWSPKPSPVAAASASAASFAEPRPQHRTFALSPSASPRARPVSSPSLSSPAAQPPAVAADPADDFRAAMATFNSGDNAAAAAAFLDFLAKHPRDPRAEDAAYLRVIALRRSGDDRSTKQAGADYLKRYPAGFRHAEVELLLR